MKRNLLKPGLFMLGGIRGSTFAQEHLNSPLYEYRKIKNNQHFVKRQLLYCTVLIINNFRL